MADAPAARVPAKDGVVIGSQAAVVITPSAEDNRDHVNAPQT
jgi:hypothetical protein